MSSSKASPKAISRRTSYGEIEERYPFCKHCGSKKVIKKDFNWRILYLESGLAVKVKIKRYECHDCKRKCQSEFSKYYEKYCNFSNNTKNKAKRLLQHGWKSLKNLKNDFNELLSLNISYESIRKITYFLVIHYTGVMRNQNSQDILAMTHNGLE